MANSDPEEEAEQPNLDELITFSQASEISGFTDRHIRKLATNHEIWAMKLGRCKNRSKAHSKTGVSRTP